MNPENLTRTKLAAVSSGGVREKNNALEGFGSGSRPGRLFCFG